MDDIDTMLKIYNTYDVDWMGDKIENSNPLTKHHIIKKAKSGENDINNYALLTVKSHRLLHYIEQNYYNDYVTLNEMFTKLNRSLMPPSNEYYICINPILKNVRKKIKNSKRKRR